MTKAIEMLTGVKFTSDFDTDKKKTIWLLKSINSLEFIDCNGNGYVDHVLFVHKGLTGWENFRDHKNKQIEFSVENISRIDPNILLDISLKVQDISTLSEKERKNS